MIKVHCDFCGQIIDTKQRYYGIESKGPAINCVFEPTFDVCPDCFNTFKNLKEKKDAN